MIDLAFKDQVRQCAQTFIQKKLQQLEQAQAILKEDLQSASKSSAGDKHETSRAMMHLEQEKLGKQEQQWLAQRQVLNALPQKPLSTVAPGALVQLEEQLYFIGPALGALPVANKNVFCLSGGAPLARAMMGKAPGERVSLGQKTLALTALL